MTPATTKIKLTDDYVNLKLRNFINYAFTAPEDLTDRDEPWPIPDALVFPLENEIAVLKGYELVKLHNHG